MPAEILLTQFTMSVHERASADPHEQVVDDGEAVAGQ
jgi:hypothetical protein